MVTFDRSNFLCKTTQTHTIRRGALRFATHISPLLNYYYFRNSVYECFFIHDLTWSKGAHAVHEPNVDRGGVSLDVIIDVSRTQGEQG